METIKIVLIIVIFALSIIDLSVTYYYISKYKEWQPNKPYKLMELNPVLRFLWERTNLLIGTLIGGVIFLTLDYIIIMGTHWIFPIILIIFLLLAIYGHVNNISLLNKLILKYPDGKLPEETFGKVEGNN